MPKTMSRLWLRWAPLLALTAFLAACGTAVAPEPAATPEPPATSEPPTRQASCDDSAIRLLDLEEGVHGAIVADTLHLGGATAPATCTDPTNESLRAGLSLADGRTAQVQQSEYYLIVIRYTSGNRLYVISRRDDGTSCVVDTNDECVAQVSDLPDDFSIDDLPDDVERTLPAGRAAPPTVTPPAAPGASPPGGGDKTPPAAAGPPGAPTNPQPADGATGVTVKGPLLSWAAAPGATSYEVYYGSAGSVLSRTRTGITTSSTSVRLSSPFLGGPPGDLKQLRHTFWMVWAKNEAGETPGELWEFVTEPVPAAPCGYSQSDLISLWLGTHPLPPAPDYHVPNRHFEGQTSVTVTSTGFVVGDVTSRFLTQDRARRWRLGEDGETCDILVASADDGRVYVMDRMSGLSGKEILILANLPGSTTPACTNRWYDAVIESFYPDGHAKYGYREGAVIKHEDC